MKATERDVVHLNGLYINRRAYHGELHDHAATGGTSDGKYDLLTWRKSMEELNMDFAAILDHKQVRHMYLPEWEDGVFIGGTEPAAHILDSKAEDNLIHYNMVFEGPKPLEELLEKFPEYKFEGGQEGHFIYAHMNREKFLEIVKTVRELGGFFVHPHPKQLMKCDDPCEYWFGDETGIEVFYRSIEHRFSEENYKLWTDLLALGKRVWACAGGDGHAETSDAALTTIYAEDRKNKFFLTHLREGDFVCGPVGIKMCVGDTKMGGKCSFGKKRLVLSVADFHNSVHNPDHKYRVDILSDKGIEASQEITCESPSYLAIDTENCKFYRAEVFDTTRNLRIAIGNPIWNEQS